MDNYQQLWQLVQQVVPGADVEPATLQLELEQYRSKLLNLFYNKGKDAGLRQQVGQGKVSTPNFGEVQLDKDPDQLLVNKLSDGLELDEVTCVELLAYAHEMWGLGGLEAGLGTYLVGRLDGARSLARLLALQLFHQLEIGQAGEAEGDMAGMAAAGDSGSQALAALMEQQPLLEVVVRFNEGMLRQQSGGKNTLISRLVAVIQDHSLEHNSDPAFAVALDQYGCPAARDWYTTQERGELCRALLYAVVLSPVLLSPATLAELLGLLHALAGRLRERGGPAAVPHAQWQQITCVLLAVVAAISMGNAAAGSPRPPVALAQLLRAQELTAHLQRIAEAKDGFSAVVALAWGLTRDALATNVHSSGGSPGPHSTHASLAQQSTLGAASNSGGAAGGGVDATFSSSALLEAAGKARALGVLSGLLRSAAFALEPEQGHRHLCARMVYRLLTEMLEFDVQNRRDLTESLIKASKQHMIQQLSSSRGGAYLPPGAPSLVATLLGPSAAAGAAAGVAAPGTPTAAGQFGQFALVPAGGAGASMQTGATVSPGQAHQQQQGLAPQDDLSSLLEALAAVFAVRPGLWYDGEAPEAYPHVSSFMSYVAVHSAMQLPDVRASFLGVMAALAAGPKGSRFILAQRYEELEREALMSGGNVLPTGLLAARDDALMPAGDAALLVSYLDLLGRIIAEGSEEEVRAALQGLERDVSGLLGGLPLYEPLFQLMCHGVQSSVKAAVHRCLASLGRFKELAPRLLDRLLMAAVVAQPAAVLEGYAGLPRFDLLAQINEVEARQEEYTESLAFLGLVNALLEGVGQAGLPAGGTAVGHYTALVLQYIAGNLWQRGYREPAQKWQLAAACFKHCQLALGMLSTCPPITPELLSRPPPGLSVLLSLMGGRQLEKALLQHVLAPGQDELAASMEVGPEGPPRQQAVLQGLKLLNLALEYDTAAAEQLSALSVRERVAPLQGLLAASPRRLAGLLQYVLYADTDIQLEAVKLLAQLAARLPNLVQLLQPNFDDSEALLLRQGCAQSLELALLDPSAGQSVSSGVAAAAARTGEQEAEGAEPATSPSDVRAELLLDVMLGSLETTAPPSLGHLLLGFDTTAVPGEWCRQPLAPSVDFTCMTVLLRALQLLYAVAAAPLTCEPVFRLLCPPEASSVLLPALGVLLLEPLAADDAAGVHAQVASLRQRAYVLRLYALTLLRCEVPAMLEPNGQAPQHPQQNGLWSGVGSHNPLQPHSMPAALRALQQICSVVLQEPSLKDVPPELLQLQQDMAVDDVSVAMLLTQPAAMELCGVVTQDDYGQPVFDFGVLQRLLHERFEEYVAKTGGRGGPGEKLARDAVAAAFTYAQRVNAHALVAGAQRAAVLGWVQSLQVAFTKTYTLVNTRTCPGAGPELLHAGARVLMSKLQELASSSLCLGLPGDPLSQVRLPVRCVALLRLLLDCLLGASSHKGLRAELYVLLLQYLTFCRGSKLGDCPPLVLASLLTGAGPGTSAAQLDALQHQLEESNGLLLRPLAGELVAVMVGDVLTPPERGGTAQQQAAWDRLDEQQQQQQQAAWDLLDEEQQQQQQQQQQQAAWDRLDEAWCGLRSLHAVALHLLSALVSADPSSTALADALHRSDVPRGLLRSVAEHAPQILLQPAHKAQAALLVLEAQLCLLLSLAAAGGPAARKGSTKAVADAGALPFLQACRALDFTPEQPSSQQRLKRSGALRYRLVHLVCPVLRLVLALLAGAPGSSGLAEQAAQFTEAHLELLARLLQEAAAPATPAWSPGDEELEQAALAVSLLAALPGAPRAAGGAAAAMSGAGGVAAGVLAGLRRDLWQLWKELAGHDRREGRAVSSIVAQLHTSRQADGRPAGAARMQQLRRRSLLLQLRCGLASVLRDAVTPAAAAAGAGAAAGAAAAGLAAASGLSGDLLTCVGHQAQNTVDAMGRPTLLLVRDTAEQAIEDLAALAVDLEDLLAFLQTADSLTSNADVAHKLADWGPGLAGLDPSNNAADFDRSRNPNGMQNGSSGLGRGADAAADAAVGESMALVLAGGQGTAARNAQLALRGSATAAAAGASGSGGLDPAAARRLARQCAARGAAALLGLLTKQLHLLEQCLAIVLLHFVQCLPRPDTAAAMEASEGGADTLMQDGGAAAPADPLLPSPGPEAAARLGAADDLGFFAGKMRDVCSGSDNAVSRVRAVLDIASETGGDAGRGLAVGGEAYVESCESVELLNRQLKAYLASL
ncbi:hypothetical protein COO60DRAFT_1638930 [Scenedesmus sp. NREL 46B-D3]|nr:hypothetical protein COO60DRAFT_1638930 [Scenedesmus sp. NREL 46B-D3]